MMLGMNPMLQILRRILSSFFGSHHHCNQHNHVQLLCTNPRARWCATSQRQRLCQARRFSTGAYTSQATADASGQYVYLAEGAGVFGFAIYNSGALATVPPENLSVETIFQTSDTQEE